MVDHKNITVLYVDDEKDNLFVFKANFNRKFEVITSISAMEALDELEVHHNQIIVVISDMRMPVMNGLEFIRIAKARYSKIFYCILTGYGYDDDIQQALSDNLILKCFTKPFDAREIEDTILLAAASRLQG